VQKIKPSSQVPEPEIVYEDNDLLVVNKPSGMVVDRAATTKKIVTLEDWLAKQGRSKGLVRQGIVHRLDKETSGLVVVAKTREVMGELQSQFKERQVKKTYLALVHGQVRPKKGKIKAPISRNPFNRKKFGVFVGGKAAETDYEVEEEYRYQGKDYGLLRLKPKTGRTHQLRVHLRHLGQPIVADELYAGRKTARNDRRWCERLWLHASQLELQQPFKKKKMVFKVKLAADLEVVLKKIRRA